MPIFVKGDLLHAKVDLIIHQCNCVTIKSHGLSEQIAKKFPFADIYSKRQARSKNIAMVYDTPGDLVISRSVNAPIIVGLLGQIGPGKPFRWASTYKFDPKTDTPEQRLVYFKQGLDKLLTICLEEKITSIGFPFQIGCGLAGGDWNDYLKAIINFETKLKFKVRIYQLDSFLE